MGVGALRVWNDDEIAPNTGFPAASPRQHGNHHLCPRRRDHPSGQPRQQGPHRSRRRPGDERGLRHPPLRIQSRADSRPSSSRSGSSRPRRAARRPGAPSPSRKRTAPGSSSPLASGFADDDGRAADPRRCARARRDAESRRERRISARRQRASAIWCRRRARSRSTACALNAATAPRSQKRRDV